MKKAISLVLVLVMAFALCGCVKNTDFILYAEMTQGEETTVLTDGMNITFGVNADNDPVLIGATVEVEGAQPIKAVLTIGAQGIGISVPALLEDYYIVEWEAIKGTAEALTSTDLSSLDVSSLPMEEITEIVERYAGILSGLVTEDNTSVTEGTYEMPGLGTNAAATIISITPTDAQWDQVYTTLISTLQTDDQLKGIISEALKAFFATAEDAEEYVNADAYAEAKMSEFEGALAEALENKDYFLTNISGLTFEAGYDDSRIYGGRFILGGAGIGYESFGEVSDVRYDGLFLYEDGTATAILANQLTSTEESFQSIASSQLAELKIVAMIDKTASTVLDLPVSGFYLGVEGTDLTVGVEQSDEYGVLYFDGVNDDMEIYIEAASDGTPSAIKEPAQEPVLISTMDQLMEIISQVSSIIGA